MSELDQLRTLEIKRSMAQLAEQGCLDRRVLSALSMLDGRCAPVECELLDYKQKLQPDRLSRGRVVADIVAFHNSHGGYLIFGVEEVERDVEYRVCGIEPGSIDIESLKAVIKDYTGQRLPITLQYLDAETPIGSRALVGLLHIPKRTSPEPLCFGKDGPGDEKSNRPIFRSDDIWFRRHDETVVAKGRDYSFLNGPRPNPYLTDLFTLAGRKTTSLEHNLPERAFICAKFVGREDVIDRLWKWFGDEFSHIRVLAGEGGLGKTSIAYQFAQEVCVTADVDLSRVLWLTAKQKQFSGLTDTVVDVPETHFSSYAALLRTLAGELGFLEHELDGASETLLKRFVKEGVGVTPTLIVIDDIDSLPPEDQRRALELGMLFGGTRSRLLATTRINQSYSDDIAIQINGFRVSDYADYVASLEERYPFATVTKQSGAVEQMHAATGGSPLFTESLFRLFRWYTPAQAIREWKGQQGEQARAAALKREVDQLTPESKRILLAAALFGDCSFSELSQVTGYPELVLRDGINQLRSLYLISAPQITEEARFSIASNTQRYVLSVRSALVGDHTRLEKNVSSLRTEARKVGSVKRDSIVGGAISQAMAQLRAGRTDDALATADAIVRTHKDHPDALTLKARCLLKLIPPRADEARLLARKAYENGSRKTILFQLWYEAEWHSGHFNGAAEASDLAIKEIGAEKDWLIRRAAAYWQIAADQERAGNSDRAIADLWSCEADIAAAIPLLQESDAKDMKEYRLLVFDSVWRLTQAGHSDPIALGTRMVDNARRMLRHGDHRTLTAQRLLEGAKVIVDDLASKSGPIPQNLRNLAEQRLREARDDVANLPHHVTRRPGTDLAASISELQQTYRTIASKRGFA